MKRLSDNISAHTAPEKAVLTTRNQTHLITLHNLLIFLLFLQNIQPVVTHPLKMAKKDPKK
jgi:hypothetical protein